MAGDRPQPDQAVRRVLDRYGYPGSVVERVEPLTRRIKNENFRVRAEGRDLVVKRYTAAQVTPTLRLSHAFQVTLRDAGFPVAELQRTTSGDTVVEDGDGHYTVHAWVDGQQFTIAQREHVVARHPSALTRVATTVGDLHRISTDLDYTRVQVPPVDPDVLLRHPRTTAAKLRRPRPPRLSRWRTLQIKRGKTTFDRWILDAVPVVTGHADRLAARSLAPHSGPSEAIILHNDINWENLIFDEELEVRALLDFDNVMRGPRVLEVGAAAVVWAGARPSRLEEFLEAYEDAARVSVDRDLVHVTMMLKCVRSILWSISTYLGGTVSDTELLASWCAHLYESLQELAHRR